MKKISSILDKYISKIIFTTVMITLFSLVFLSTVIKFVDQQKKVGQGHYNIISAGIYTTLSIPKDIQVFFPVAILIGTTLALGVLSKHNELIVMQASGFSYIQISFSVMKTAILLILSSMIIGEWIAPKCEQIARNYREKAIYNGSLLSIHQGIWIKDNDDFIYIKRINGNNELSEISIYEFDNNYSLQSIRYAISGKFNANKNIWFLTHVEKFSFQDSGKIISSKINLDTLKISLTPDKLHIIAVDPNTLSIKNLNNYISYLKSSGQATNRYQLNMWSKIFQPISVIVMMILALSFIFGSFRKGRTSGIRMIASIGFSFLFYVLIQAFEPLMLFYHVSPILSALLPNIIFLLIDLLLIFNDYNLLS